MKQAPPTSDISDSNPARKNLEAPYRWVCLLFLGRIPIYISTQPPHLSAA